MSIDPIILTQVMSAPSAMQRAQTAAVSEKAGIAFYRFQGRPIKTTRPWCLAREGKVWHIEEIREWGRQAAAGQGWDGMVEGTNEQTIMTYLGGWYGNRSACRHVLVPVLPSRVPAEDMDRIRKKGLLPNDRQGAQVQQAVGVDARNLEEIRDTWRDTLEDRTAMEANHEALAADFKDRVFDSLTKEQYGDLRSYTQDRYGAINDVLRGKDKDEWATEQIANIRGIFDAHRLNREVITYRGVTGRAGDALAKNIQNVATGTEMKLEGFTSTSLKPATAHISKSSAVLRIKLPPGSKALYIEPVSAFKGEFEVLIDHGMRFKVLGTELVGDKVYIDLIGVP